MAKPEVEIIGTRGPFVFGRMTYREREPTPAIADAVARYLDAEARKAAHREAHRAYIAAHSDSAAAATDLEVELQRDHWDRCIAPDYDLSLFRLAGWAFRLRKHRTGAYVLNIVPPQEEPSSDTIEADRDEPRPDPAGVAVERGGRALQLEAAQGGDGPRGPAL